MSTQETLHPALATTAPQPQDAGAAPAPAEGHPRARRHEPAATRGHPRTAAARGRLAGAPVRGPLLELIEQAGLRGRGGGGFPTASKLRAVASSRGRPIVVVNAAESEPASRKDRTLLESLPHLVLDGAQLVAQALARRRADRRRLRVRGRERQQPRPGDGRTRLWPARARPHPHGRAAQPVRGRSGDRARELSKRRAGATRLHPAAAIPAGRGAPPDARRQPRDARARRPDRTPRPALVSSAGHAVRAGLSARHAVGPGRLARGVRDRAGRVCVRPPGGGGRHALARAHAAARRIRGQLDRRLALRRRRAVRRGAQAQLGAALGAGVVALLSEHACPVAETARVARWLAEQSAGQCGPCVHGLAALADGVQRARRGRRPAGRRAAGGAGSRRSCAGAAPAATPTGRRASCSAPWTRSRRSSPTTLATARATRARAPPSCRFPRVRDAPVARKPLSPR